jgi:dTDP-4-amino-4,6-dideoxy-D-galactose acyltransferase
LTERDLEHKKESYYFIELPAEANILIQSLTSSGFILVETRIHQYLKNIQEFNYQKFPVRKANMNDAFNLKKVSSSMRNPYDRFHSDVSFTDFKADQYLGKFAYETVNGLADFVLVPNEYNIKPNAMIAVNHLKDNWSKLNANVSQLVLAAVDSTTCKGWYEKLLSGVCFYLKDLGAEYLISNTQATNKAPIHVNEKLGFKTI